MKPVRIQRKRTKGWKMPPNTVDVTRSGKWGNPFIVSPNVRAGSRSGCFYTCVPTVEDAVECHRIMMMENSEYLEQARRELRGKNLACFCKIGDPCHGDTLLEIANADVPQPKVKP